MAVVGSGISNATNVATSTSAAGIANEVMTFYEKTFLDRAKYALVLDQGAQKRTHSANSGRTINFTRREPLSIITTPLGEASNPVTCQINSCTVAVTLSEYGLTVNTSRMATLVGIDGGMKETIEQQGQNMGETLNRLVRVELESGTAFYPNGHHVASFTAGDVLDACNIRLMVRTLELARAMPYKDGMFLGKTDSYSKLRLLTDTAWINGKTYSDVKDLYRGEMGELFQVRWLLNNDLSSGTEAASTASSTTTRFYTYVHGDQSFGTFDIETDKPKLYILPNVVDSNSPAGRMSIVTWAGSYATKLLNSNWVLSARFAAS